MLTLFVLVNAVAGGLAMMSAPVAHASLLALRYPRVAEEDAQAAAPPAPSSEVAAGAGRRRRAAASRRPHAPRAKPGPATKASTAGRATRGAASA